MNNKSNKSNAITIPKSLGYNEYCGMPGVMIMMGGKGGWRIVELLCHKGISRFSKY